MSPSFCLEWIDGAINILSSVDTRLNDGSTVARALNSPGANVIRSAPAMEVGSCREGARSLWPDVGERGTHAEVFIKWRCMRQLRIP